MPSSPSPTLNLSLFFQPWVLPGESLKCLEHQGTSLIQTEGLLGQGHPLGWRSPRPPPFQLGFEFYPSVDTPAPRVLREPGSSSSALT